MAQSRELTLAEANARMIGEFFAGIDTRATLPGLQAIVERWRPDVVVRESWEFASGLVAELHGIPLARVGLALAAIEERATALAAPQVDAARALLGLAPDPAGDRMRETPYLTMMPAALEDPAAPLPARTHRFAEGPPPEAAPLPDWWPGNDDPLVYVTLGSVAAGAHLPYYPAVYRDAIAELAPLEVRILLTIGSDRDPAELGALPANVHVEDWVAQDDVAPHAAAIVGHGGYGTTLGALRHGVPLVVLPLFSADQWANAAAVARAGAGLALDAERDTRMGLALPAPATLAELGPAVRRVLGDASFRRAAQDIARASSATPTVEAAVGVLERLAAT
jgi:UDP:flavonoid glycosyltransferase YjiC (YdhE family)